jgi:type IV pilus assembly protein PilO
MNMNWLKNLPPLQRNLIGGFVVLLVLGLTVYFVHVPKVQRIGALKGELAQLGSEVSIYQAKVKRLDELMAENDRLQHLLAEQRRQLPEQHEVADLLEQVSDAGTRSGLVFRLWRPGPAVPHESGLYQSLPVQVEVWGGYHQLGVFFEKVAHLDRIVNIGDLKMAPEKGGGGGLTTQFTATAFAALSPEQAQAIQEAAAQKAGKGKKAKS